MTTESRTDFARRQAALMAERGLSSADARNRLREALGSDLNIEDSQTDYTLIESLLSQPGLGSSAADRLRIDLVASALRRSGAFTQTVKAIASIQAYAIGVGVVATLIWLIWFRFVLPQFAAIYQSFGADLPQLTRWIMDPLIVAGILIAIWLPVVLLAVGGLGLQRMFRRLNRPPGWLASIPVVRSLLQVYTDWLSVIALRALADQSVSPNRALEIIRGWRQHNGMRSEAGRRRSELGLDQCVEYAARFGTTEDELDYQSERLELEFPIQAARIREWVMVCLLGVFGICIGIMVVAMYLPIFGLAGVM